MIDIDNPFDYLTSLTNKGRKLKRRPNTLVEETVAEENLDSEIDICRLVREVVSDTSRMPRDLRIDDGDMPLARNFYEWSTSDDYAGNLEKPFLEQLISGVILFAEWCPVCSDREWLYENHKVDDTYGKFSKKVCCLEHGICPGCGLAKHELVKDHGLNFYNEMALRIGQRGGKSAMTGGQISPYITHRVLKMQKPNSVYGLMPSNMFHGTFTALTYAQAKDTLWQFYYGALLENTWFQEYHKLLRHYENLYGEKIFKFNDTFVQYRHRNLTYYPAGPDLRVLRGKTRIQAGIDEIGYFDNDAASKKVKMSARGVYEALERSLLTVRAKSDKLLKAGYDNILTGYFTNVSSPSHIRDMICELTRRAVHSKKMYGRVLPTWKMNPNVPREALEDEFAKDPVAAMKDYGAEPPLTSNPFLPSIANIEELTFDSKKNGAIIKHKQRKSSDGSLTRYAIIEKIRKTNKPGILGIDAGYSNNSFALACGQLIDGMQVFDALIEIMPLPGIPLNYTLIYDNVICPVIEARNIKIVVADRWNSLKLLSDLEVEFESREMMTMQYSLKYRDFWTLKTLIDQQSITFPKADTKNAEIADLLNFPQDEYPRCFERRAADHLLVQAATVQDSGSQILKGEGLTDDIWRAVAIASWGMEQEEFQDILNADATMSAGRIIGTLGVSRLGSAGARGGMSSSGSTLGAYRSGKR